MKKLSSSNSPSTPIPTRIISNGEYDPMLQTDDQKKVESAILDIADTVGREKKISRRDVLQSSSAIAVGLLGLNKVFGEYFDVRLEDILAVSTAHAAPHSRERSLIFDVQTHLVRDGFHHPTLVKFAKWADTLNIKNVVDKKADYDERFRLPNFLKEIFIESQTDGALLSGAPFSNGDPLPNGLLYRICDAVNETAGAKVLYANHVVNPNIIGWLEDAKSAAPNQKPISWKLFPVGDPLSPTGKPWRLDDRKLIYPFYEFAMKSGIRNITIHKGLTPRHYETKYPEAWRAAQVDDLKQAAKDWPGLNFIIFHSALRAFASDNLEADIARFEASGDIMWVSDLMKLAQENVAGNIYAEIGTSFASSCVSHPRFCAAFLGTLLNGVGPERILWGTDSVWYGSPQWQIEAFRSLRIPEDIMAKRKWKIGLSADSASVREKIFSGNALRVFKFENGKRRPFQSDWIEKTRKKISRTEHRYYGYYA